MRLFYERGERGVLGGSKVGVDGGRRGEGEGGVGWGRLYSGRGS